MAAILFVDDHPIYRDAVRRTLQQEVPDLTVVTADGVSSAFRAFEDCEIDLCLSDHRLPDGDGLSLLSEIKRRHPLVALGILCAELSPAIISGARSLGAVLCLSKDRTSDELVTAVNIAFAGGHVYEPVGVAAEAEGLSLRRREILMYASQGLLDKQIGERLRVTESTVRAHWSRIFEQLGVSNRTEAVTKALRRRMI